MASNINETNINADYPVAGQDNDSQGFRDNFSVIKNNFGSAKTEIESLQTNTAKKNEDNDFLGFQLTGANLIANTEVVNSGGSLSSSQNVSFSNGHMQTFTVAADITLTLSDWPDSGKLGKMTVMLLSNAATNRVVTWAVEAGGNLVTNSLWPTEDLTTTISDDEFYTVFDFWSIDGGATVFGEYKGIFN